MNTSLLKRRKNCPWIFAIPTIFAAFMVVLDSTIANVALPHMAGTFSVSREESIWILTSYLVASGVMIPAVDFFCKLMGRKVYFITSVVVFTIASFLCGFANSIELMIFARILQGLGGGGLIPLSQAILLESFPIEERGKGMAMFGLVVIFAPIIGPVLGGYITDNWNWPWIFFINVPIGIFTTYLAKILLVDPPYAKKQKNINFDKLGFLFLTLWLVSLQIIFDKGNNADWFNAPWVCRLATFSGLCCILFFISQYKSKNALVDLSVFKDRNFAIGTIIQIIMQAVLLASVAILPMFLQLLMGYTAYLSGLAIMPRGIGSLIAVSICGYLSDKIDNRWLVVAGLFLLGAAGFGLGFLNLQIASINIAIPNFLFGLGMGLAMVPLIALSVVTLRNDQMTNASGLQQLLKQIGGAVGTSLVATLISRFGQIHQAYLIRHLSFENPVFQARINAVEGALSNFMDSSIANHMAQYSIYGELLKQANLWGFMEAFRIFGILCLVVIPTIFLLKKIELKKS